MRMISLAKQTFAAILLFFRLYGAAIFSVLLVSSGIFVALSILQKRASHAVNSKPKNTRDTVFVQLLNPTIATADAGGKKSEIASQVHHQNTSGFDSSKLPNSVT